MCLLFAACRVVLLLAATAPTTAAASADRPPARETFDRLNAQLLAGQTDQPLDNVKGGIAWGASYQMDAYVDMYRATNDPAYLDQFVRLCDRVMAARADKAGQPDYAGRITRGWLSGGHYTHGRPITLPDRDGRPSLRLETIAHSHNNLSSIRIISNEVGPTFSIELTNTMNPTKPVKKTWAELTMDTVEQKVNPPPGQRGYLRVTRRGERVPISCGPLTAETQLICAHGHHTGRILTPVTRFCTLVLATDGPSQFRPKAMEYLEAAKQSMREHDQFFFEDGDAGYTAFEKGVPIWSDGAPEPHNTIAASGSAYVHLYAATGEAYFLDKATRLARLIKRHIVDQPDGTKSITYWWGIGLTGWKPQDGISINTPLWPGNGDNPENVSHFQLTLQFIIDCQAHGIVFTKQDLEGWARTFLDRIYVPDDKGGRLNLYVTGRDLQGQSGAKNQCISGFAALGAVADRRVYQACRRMYNSQFGQQATAYQLACWAVLARGECALR